MHVSNLYLKMEDLNFKKLETLIEALTHSGANTIDEEIFKQVKKICKSSNNYIPHAYKTLIKQLKKNNSQIRYVAFQICKELFDRSGLFRQCLLKDLRMIFELTAEVSSGKKLPPPKTSAESLKVFSVSTLKKWVEQYGEVCKELKVAYNYLQKCKKVDFERLEVRGAAEQAAANEQQRRIREFNNERIKKLMEEFSINESEIQETVTSLSNCLNLLLPTLDDFFISENNMEEPVVSGPSPNFEEVKKDDNDYDLLGNKNNLREFGLSSNYSLSVQINPKEKFRVVVSEENSSVVENAKDCVRLISNRFLPLVKKWAKLYCKYSDERNTTDIKKILDLKEQLEQILKKYNSLNIEGLKGIVDDESSDDDFEEVKKEGYEDSIDLTEDDLIQAIANDIRKETSEKTNSKISKLAVPNATKGEEPVPSTSGTSSKELDRKKKLLAVAPKLPFDVDLYHWEDENLTTPTLISTKIDVDKFWGCAGSDDIHEIPNSEGIASLRTRVIEFTGKFEPVKWSCRAPLPNGKLCPRKDRYKCPFHGKIVPRDETGKCKNEKDETVAEEPKKLDTSEWQDPQLLKDLKAATGVDLKLPEGRKKRKKIRNNNLTHKKMKTSSAALRILESKKLPGLVDVVRKQNNAYTRLSKKIFHRSSLRRVSKALNKLERNKFHDKFGDQFNYSLK